MVESASVSRILTVSKWSTALVPGAWVPDIAAHIAGASVDFSRYSLSRVVGNTWGHVKMTLREPGIVMWDMCRMCWGSGGDRSCRWL